MVLFNYHYCYCWYKRREEAAAIVLCKKVMRGFARRCLQVEYFSSSFHDFGHCHNVALIDTLLTSLTLIDDLLGIYYIICTMGAIVVVFRSLPQGKKL